MLQEDHICRHPKGTILGFCHRKEKSKLFRKLGKYKQKQKYQGIKSSKVFPYLVMKREKIQSNDNQNTVLILLIEV